MPLKLQANDWFLIVSIIISMVSYFIIRKRFTFTVRIMIWVYIIFLVQTVDFVLGVKPYDFYDFMDSPKWELIYAISQFTLYPVLGYLFLHLYDKWGLKGLRLIGYILGWVLFFGHL